MGEHSAAAAERVRPATGGSRLRRLGHRPVLDGLRGSAFLLVFIGHAGWLPFLRAAQTAMFLFFALSGFLITALLAEEHDRTGRIGLGNFFARRGLRLVPALVVFLAIWLVVVTVFSGSGWLLTAPGLTSVPGHGLGVATALREAGIGAAYVANWSLIYIDQSSHQPLTHLWSLSVEEQFYVFWAPVIVVLLAAWSRISSRAGRARRPGFGALAAVAALLGCASIGEAVARYLLLQVHQARVTYGTDTRAGAFLIGGALAVAWSSGAMSRAADAVRSRAPGILRVSPRAASAAMTIAAVALVLSGRAFGQAQGHLGKALAFAAASVLAPLVVCGLTAVPQSALGRALSHPVMVYVGRRSYALYLWHYVMLTWFHDLGTLGDVLALGASLGAAELSWRLVERPALRVKWRFEPQPESRPESRPEPPPEPVAGPGGYFGGMRRPPSRRMVSPLR